jgi:hypothetical protein
MGGVLLLALSISAAFGADPSESGPNRGQQVAAFVHELVFGSDTDTDTDESEQEDEDADEADEESDEADGADEESDEAEDTDEQSDESDSATGAEHGACVAEWAHDKLAVGGPNENHGGAVSEAARVTCWEDGSEDGVDEEEESSVDEQATDEEMTAKEQRKADREAAKAERRAQRDAAKAERRANHGHGRP